MGWDGMGRDGMGWARPHPREEVAGEWHPPFEMQVEHNDPRCVANPQLDYIEIEHSHNAFFCIDEMIRRGVPAEALSVVRLWRRK